MKRLRKIIVGVLVGLFVILAATLIWIDHVADVAVETGATYALGVETSLGAMDVGIVSGSIEMGDLKIANPEGFDTPHFLRLSSGRVAVTLGSLLQDQVEVPELSLAGVNMNLEKKGGRSNYQVILDSLKKFESAEDASKSDDVADGKRFVVRRVSITDVNVQVDALPVGGELTRIPLKIERIELENIGTGEGNGAGVAQIINTITQAILSSVANVGGGLIPADIAGELNAGLSTLSALGGASVEVLGDVTATVGGEVKRVTDIGQGAVKELGDGAKEAAKELDGVGKKLGEGIGGIFTPKKKKEPKADD